MEVVFGESACGSLKMAQQFGEGEYISSVTTAVFLTDEGPDDLEAARQRAEDEARREWEEGIPMGGKPEDVYDISFALDIGDISEAVPGQRREAVLESLSAAPAEGKRILTDSLQSLRSILERTAKGEPLRIWYSNAPGEMCGLYFMMAQLASLRGEHGPVSIVRLPQFEMLEEIEEIAKRETLIQRNSWGDVTPGEWARFLPLEKQVPALLLRVLADTWEKLRQENAPLRAVLNGRLVSAPENLYDSYLIEEMWKLDEEFREILLLGNVYNTYQLAVSDAYLAGRITALIEEGKIAEMEDSPRLGLTRDRLLKRKKM